jgi:hypothetical protein
MKLQCPKCGEWFKNKQGASIHLSHCIRKAQELKAYMEKYNIVLKNSDSNEENKCEPVFLNHHVTLMRSQVVIHRMM